MNCPVCRDTRMREVEKNGVLIDICPSCKGVWLDRGELEKLMTEVREVREDYNRWYYDDDDDDDRRKRQAPYPPRQDSYQDSQRDARYDHKSDGSHYGGHKRKKKRSVMDMFGDLFD
ncbi:zf-TFIIB domain-containing protein [Cohnella lubricantis]|uniref:Zf-TFIIB domain-containing protein n=1 Tax=Cohnella lubricantis TaxID=2163172 RepID=A0A841T7C9_9BACL|nr:zf-TFIIB domain-containing protein [Cohnella lubricantis]MBB6676802.1 zf-TFIIB domain-containing protein [Cohnella lubricantis]MBP2118110.1 Zn-finger nucleic acid-binding protein [Cohnella lubricantis]